MNAGKVSDPVQIPPLRGLPSPRSPTKQDLMTRIILPEASKKPLNSRQVILENRHKLLYFRCFQLVDQKVLYFGKFVRDTNPASPLPL